MVTKTFVLILGLAGIVISAAVEAKESNMSFLGSYVGINIGGTWGSSNYQTNPGCPPSSNNATFCGLSPDPSASNGNAVSASGTGKFSVDGYTVGGYIGHNWIVNNILLGGEADIGSFDLSKSTRASGSFPFVFLGDSYALTESMSTQWFATIRGRIGATVKPRLLLYATGGAAFTDFTFSSTYSDNAIYSPLFPGGSGNGKVSNTRTGWTIGGGGEWLLADRCSIKLEYLYADFGSVNIPVPVSNTQAFTQTMNVNADLRTQLLRAGLSYKFNEL